MPIPALLAFRIGFMTLNWADAADIVLVGILMYEITRLVKGTVTGGVLLGAAVLYVLYLLVKAAGMDLLTTILDQFMNVGVVAAIILFQPELRKFLLKLGQGTAFRSDFSLRKLFSRGALPDDTFNLQPALEAARSMSQSHTGALIVFSRSTDLKTYASTGDEIDAVLSKRLLTSIFNKTSPLHDGAVIIEEGRVRAARCILPLSETDKLPAKRGLRHRASLGISEQSDAVVLVVSEQDGQISIAIGGRLETNLSITEARARLKEELQLR